MKKITETMIHDIEIGTEIYFNFEKHPDIFQGITAEGGDAFIKSYENNQTFVYDFDFICNYYKLNDNK